MKGNIWIDADKISFWELDPAGDLIIVVDGVEQRWLKSDYTQEYINIIADYIEKLILER